MRLSALFFFLSSLLSFQIPSAAHGQSSTYLLGFDDPPVAATPTPVPSPIGLDVSDGEFPKDGVSCGSPAWLYLYLLPGTPAKSSTTSLAPLVSGGAPIVPIITEGDSWICQPSKPVWCPEVFEGVDAAMVIHDTIGESAYLEKSCTVLVSCFYGCRKGAPKE